MLLAGSWCAATAQSADERAGMCMNSSDWFGLLDIYENENDSLSPFIRAFAKAMTDDAFNQNEAAVKSIGELIADHQEEMGMANIASMVFFMASNLSEMGQNEAAANTLKSFLDQSKALFDSTSCAVLEKQEKIYRDLSAYEVNRIENPDRLHEIPFDLDSVGRQGKRSVAIMMRGSVNGTPYKIVFDTGAGINVITPECARQLNLTPLDAQISMSGMGTAEGVLAIADRVQLGSLTLRNVPFYIVEMTTGVDSLDKYLSHCDCVMGVPLMQAFGEVQMDFSSNHLTVPAVQTDSSLRNLYMNAGNGIILQADHEGEKMQFHIDTGDAGFGSLSYPYYSKNAHFIEEKGDTTTYESAGIGGAQRVRAYNLHDFNVEVDGVGCSIPQIPVVAEPDNMAGGSPMIDGRLGVKFFTQFKRVTINLRKMFFRLEGKSEKQGNF